MASKQIEDWYNDASPIERAKRYPMNDQERRLSKLARDVEDAERSRTGSIKSLLIENEIAALERRLKTLQGK